MELQWNQYLISNAVCNQLYPSLTITESPPGVCISIPERGTIPLFIVDDLCHTYPLAFSKVLYLLQQYVWIYHLFAYKQVWVMILILSLMSIDMVLSCLSNVRLSGICLKPHAFIISSYCKDNPIPGIHVMHCSNPV